MNRDEVIRVAREAGIPVAWISERGVLTWGELERFAALVAAAEREACAQILDRNADACANITMLADVLRSNANAIRARSRE